MRYSIGPKFLARILLETNHFDNQGRVALECLLCSYRESLSGYQYHTSSKHTRLQLDGQNANQMSQIGSIQSDSELQSIRSRVGPKCGNEICSRSVRPSTYPSDRPAASVSPSSHGSEVASRLRRLRPSDAAPPSARASLSNSSTRRRSLKRRRRRRRLPSLPPSRPPVGGRAVVLSPGAQRSPSAEVGPRPFAERSAVRVERKWPSGSS